MMTTHKGIVAVMAVGALLVALSPAAQGALIAHWTLDEGSGTSAGDTSGSPNTHNGGLVGGQEPIWLPGASARLGGSALSFVAADNGVSGDLVSVPHHIELNLPNAAFTLSFWYRLPDDTMTAPYPGPFRKGSAGEIAPAAGGYIVFRLNSTDRLLFKSRNSSPSWSLAASVGNWIHYLLAFDGTSGNIFYTDGSGTSQTANWGAPITTTAVLEFGRADAYDRTWLDDIGIWNEQLGAAKARSLYTVPTALGYDYDIADVSALWAIHAAGPGGSGVVEGIPWYYTANLPGSPSLGDAYVDGLWHYVALGEDSGVVAMLPEPGTMLLLGAGLLPLWRRRRRRKA